ncbi:MAG: protein kinase domain-containing protein [Planctomycetota bacterium]
MDAAARPSPDVTLDTVQPAVKSKSQPTGGNDEAIVSVPSPHAVGTPTPTPAKSARAPAATWETTPLPARPRTPPGAADLREPGTAATEPGRGSEAPRSRPHDATLERSAPSSASRARFESEDQQGVPGVPATIGGYRVLKLLGEGGMGAVYLARQISLQRNVALKTIRSAVAGNPVYIARFTREAFAAAQLTHHNVAQIYDMGEDRGVHYFSMEYVDGEPLSKVVDREGRVRPDEAAGYLLQAARGLKFAHDHGMVHRDAKPANLLLNHLGVVKVVDLGLVKLPETGPAVFGPSEFERSPHARARGSSVTDPHMAMGTPDFMAPEQSDDAAHVDHRADIYSLGCSFYVLLTGEPPFRGNSVIEVLSKHKTEPVVRPDLVVDHLPPRLADITVRMMAKDVTERYSDLGQVIADIERYLGIDMHGVFEPSEEQLRVLRAAVGTLRNVFTRRLRQGLIYAFPGACALLALAGLMFGSTKITGGALLLLILAPLAYFVVQGVRGENMLFRRTAALLLAGGWPQWVTLGFAGAVLLVTLWALGLLLPAAVIGGLAAVLAAALHFTIDRQLALERSVPLDHLNAVLRQLRLRGVDEDLLRRFVAEHAGTHWEEFFEAVFGYDEKIAARAQWGTLPDGRPRPRFAAWRDPIVRWLDRRTSQLREARQRSHLLRVEQKKLRAEGFSASQARFLARNAAEVLVAQAAKLREVSSDPEAAAAEAIRRRELLKSILQSAATGPAKRRPTAADMFRQAMPLLDAVAGASMRFVVGCLLLLLCALWVHQTADDLGLNVTGAPLDITQSRVLLDETLRPLPFPFLPPWLAGGLQVGVAGLILASSAFFGGARASLVALPAAALAVGGAALGLPAMIPGVGPAAVGALLGVVVFIAGVLVLNALDAAERRKR